MALEIHALYISGEVRTGAYVHCEVPVSAGPDADSYNGWTLFKLLARCPTCSHTFPFRVSTTLLEPLSLVPLHGRKPLVLLSISHIHCPRWSKSDALAINYNHTLFVVSALTFPSKNQGRFQSYSTSALTNNSVPTTSLRSHNVRWHKKTGAVLTDIWPPYRPRRHSVLTSFFLQRVTFGGALVFRTVGVHHINFTIERCWACSRALSETETRDSLLALYAFLSISYWQGLPHYVSGRQSRRHLLPIRILR